MSLGVYPVFKNRSFQHGYSIDGTALAREIEALDTQSLAQGLKPLSGFDSANVPLPDGFAGDPAELPEPKPSWFSPVDGLKTVEALLRALSFHRVSLAQPDKENEVLEELRELQRALERAAERRECFQLKLG